jgi:hypothetical protein
MRIADCGFDKWYAIFFKKDKAKRFPHSTFDVKRSMFDVQLTYN